MSIKTIIGSIVLCAVVSAPSAWAVDYAMVRFHDENSDTLQIIQMLKEIDAMQLRRPGDMVLAAAQQFLGKPYVAHTLEGEQEYLTVNVEEVDCTTLVDNAMALAMTINERRTSWRDFLFNLERERYRNGTLKGYPSRLHYISDWAVDNMHRGIIKDATPLFTNYSYAIKSLDFMSSNADKYAALADSANLAGIKSIEMGYRSHRFPYIKIADVGNKKVAEDFQNGDILAFVLKDKNLDVGHMGILMLKDGVPYVLHASSSAGKVVISDVPLQEFLKRNRQYMGVRIFRLLE